MYVGAELPAALPSATLTSVYTRSEMRGNSACRSAESGQTLPSFSVFGPTWSQFGQIWSDEHRYRAVELRFLPPQLPRPHFPQLPHRHKKDAHAMGRVSIVDGRGQELNVIQTNRWALLLPCVQRGGAVSALFADAEGLHQV